MARRTGVRFPAPPQHQTNPVNRKVQPACEGPSDAPEGLRRGWAAVRSIRHSPGVGPIGSVSSPKMDATDTGRRFGELLSPHRPWPARVIAGWVLTVTGMVVWHWLWTPALVAIAVLLMVSASRSSASRRLPNLEASDGALPPGSWEPVMPPHPHQPQD
jgi:hypothetical protein